MKPVWPLLFLMLSKLAGAEPLLDRSRSWIAGSFQFYTGSRGTSLSGANAFGAEFGIQRNNSWLALFSKVSGQFSTGTEEFNDGSTSNRSLGYTLFQTHLHVGLRIYPIPAKELGLRPYVGGAGLAGITYLSFSSSSLQALQPTYTGLSYGYEAHVGVDITFKAAENFKGTHFFIEAQFRSLTSNIADTSNFALGGYLLVFGLGW